MQVLQDFHKRLALFLFTSLILAACGEQSQQRTVTAQTLAQAEALLEDAALTEAALSPEITSLWGLDTTFAPSVKLRLSGTSQAAFERERLLRLDLQSRLANAPVLPDDHPLARDLLVTRLALQDAIVLQKFGIGRFRLSDTRPYTIDPFSSLWIEGPETLIRDHSIDTPQDAEDYIRRMAALADGIQDTRRRLLADAATGTLAPTDLLLRTDLRIRKRLKENAFADILTTLDSFSRDLGPANGRTHDGRMTAAAQIYNENLIPAYQELAETLTSLQQQAPISVGLWTQPGGVTLYNDLIRIKAAPDIRSDDLWQSLTLITDAMPDVRDAYTISTDSPPVPAVRTDLEEVSPPIEPPQIGLPNSTLLTPQAGSAIPPFFGLTFLPKRVDGRRPVLLEWHYDRWVELPADIRRALTTETRLNAAAQYYQAVGDSTARSPIRAYLLDNGFYQGWLAYRRDQTDPNSAALERLETVSATVDLAIHTQRWNRQTAMEFATEKTGLPQQLSDEMVMRVIANPAEAVGIYVHRERFRSLEARARQVLGPDFDLSKFQTVLLMDGPRPLPLVERDVDDWYQTLLADR